MKDIKLIILHLFFALSFVVSSGQQIGNYVNNGSFEELNNCTANQLSDRMKFWSEADSSKDAYRIFNTCLGIVPGNSANNDYQFPRTGNGYVGSTLLSQVGVRGYFRNTLKSTLQANKIYCVKFFVNVRNYSPYGIDAIQAYFGDATLDTIHNGNVVLTYLSPQISNPTGNMITDTLNWLPITGTFVANGTEKYMMLGNFKAFNSTNTILINSSNNTGVGCDILFDDVSCMESNLSAYAGPDQYINLGDSIFIGRQPDFATDSGCIWYNFPTMTPIDTVSGIWVKPAITSTYIVRQELSCSSVKFDTVTVYIDAVGIKESQLNPLYINIYPNPASESFSISFSTNLIGIDRVSIVNCLGQTIREQDVVVKNNSCDFNVSGLEKGIYQIHFKTKNGIVTRQFCKY